MADLISAFCGMMLSAWGLEAQHDRLAGATHFPSGVSDRPAWVATGQSCSVMICSESPALALAVVIPQKGGACPLVRDGPLAAARLPPNYTTLRPATEKIGPPALLLELEAVLAAAGPTSRLATLGAPEIAEFVPASDVAQILIGETKLAGYSVPGGSPPFALFSVNDDVDLPHVLAPLSSFDTPVNSGYFGPNGAIVISNNTAYAFQGPTSPSAKSLSVSPPNPLEALSLGSCLYAQDYNRVGWAASLALSRVFPSASPRNPDNCEIVP